MLKEILGNITIFCHSAIKFEKEKIYFDPFKLKEEYHDANIIFITHDHYDHFSKEDILKVKKEDTKIVLTKDMYDKAIELGFKEEDILVVYPNREYELNHIKIKTIPAYNHNRTYHPKAMKWVGYLIHIGKDSYYIAGDTDITEENSEVRCKTAFLPVGGIYTMDYKEAARLANILCPKYVILIHYGCIVGTKEDAKQFSELLNPSIICCFKIK